MSYPEDKLYDVCIIGTGLAGLAATLFAANRGLSCIEVGQIGEINFASGLMDLLGVYPAGDKHVVTDPWKGIKALVRENPKHPYARLPTEDIRGAFDEILTFLDQAGLPYKRRMNFNVSVLTPLGTLKPTYCVPQTMWNGVEALAGKTPGLLIDIRGLKGFSAGLVAAALKNTWPDLHTANITFPGTDHLSEVLTEQMASALILSENREKFARTLQPHIEEAQVVGLPAILGLYRSREVVDDLEQMLGVRLFEIPTIPPSVSGLRLKEAFERELRDKGVLYYSQKKVLEIQTQTNKIFRIGVGRTTVERWISARGVILASGRFIGGGLHADRKRIKETILNLPVYQPENRAGWHRRNLLDPQGHLVNCSGVEIDDAFRPLNASHQPVYQSLFAAGSILAHNDWKRLKCGAGVAIATAYGAVKSLFGSYR